MMKRKYIFPAVLLFLAGSPVLAQATHIHYEDYGDSDITLDATSTTANTFTWYFDLETDTMELWEIPEEMVESHSYDFSINPDDYERLPDGSMDPEAFLHYAYLTLKFSSATNDTIEFVLEDLITADTISILNGGLPPNDPLYDALIDLDPFIFGSSGALNVTSYLRDDHKLEVTITAMSGSFTVSKLDLAGCYEDVAPVPEPATMLLFGTGLAGVAGFARKKYRA
ncbi:MAG: PEP-CTERM sorting domain-containing protein [Desulfurivibrio sp.]|nr:MAG: PEP-CTERM sorting domain-containing protein [Desulfurivibrio sp.]